MAPFSCFYVIFFWTKTSTDTCSGPNLKSFQIKCVDFKFNFDQKWDFGHLKVFKLVMLDFSLSEMTKNRDFGIFGRPSAVV